MARLLVVGGIHERDEDASAPTRTRFATALGRQIIAQGHVLLGGCRTTLDREVAVAAAQEAKNRNLDPRKVVRSWVTATTKPVHSEGEVIRSAMSDWSHVPRGRTFPEPVHEADAVLVVGGWEGTHYAASWARLASKPLLPVATLGLAAEEIFKEELHDFGHRYASRIGLDDFQMLNRILPDDSATTVDTYATEVVALAERMIMPSSVFVIMSFAQDGHLIDAYNTMKRVCKEFKFDAFKVDHHIDNRQRIVPSIFDAIRRSAFILADLSEPTTGKPSTNVYYELGFAHALGKDILVSAKQGTTLPFDVFDVATLFWDSQSMLETKLKEEIPKIAVKFGRLRV